MKRRHTIVALAVAVLAGCSDSKPTPAGSGPAGGGGTGGGASGTGGRGAGAGGGVDAAAGATAEARPDAVADRVDGGGVADAPVVATEAGPTDLRPVRDTAASDGRFRYPDPAGELCGNSKHALAKSPAEVLVVLDRSASMDEFTLPPATKWDDATDAVKLVMAANPGIAWGIKLFPTADVECALSPDVEVPTRFGAAASVAAVMDAAGQGHQRGSRLPENHQVGAAQIHRPGHRRHPQLQRGTGSRHDHQGHRGRRRRGLPDVRDRDWR
jgi:hypothetical protein